jgi:hypothetical protein
VRSVPSQYTTCRAWGHNWTFTTVQRAQGEFIQGMRCLGCGTERWVTINSKNGMREHGNKYKYPEQLDKEAAPYQLPKDTGGHFTAEERGACTLEDVKSRYAARDNELAKRRRKA